jgi:hypothetical protein
MPMGRHTDEAIDAYCRDLYDRTRALWITLKGKYPTWCCRFSILYGPPMFSPDLLILGSNPGFDPSDLYDEEILTWPTDNEYTTQSWRLAKKLRSIFAEAGLEDLLKRSLGTNRLFFKSKNLNHHESGLGWADNPPNIQKQLGAYCANELEKLIRLLEPRVVFALGLSVFDDVADAVSCEIKGVKGRRVAAIGRVDGSKMLGIIHPTGARVSNEDWSIVAKTLARELGGSIKNGFIDELAPQQRPEQRYINNRAPTAAKPARQRRFQPDTVVKAATKPPGAFGYQPIHDFWRELSQMDEVTVELFHQHMVSTGWRRPQGGALTYDVTRTDIACMCREGFATRVRG